MTPETPAALLALNLDTLVGMTVDQAIALVESRDGQLRTYQTGRALHLDFRPNRVTALVEDGRVVSVRGIG